MGCMKNVDGVGGLLRSEGASTIPNLCHFSTVSNHLRRFFIFRLPRKHSVVGSVDFGNFGHITSGTSCDGFWSSALLEWRFLELEMITAFFAFSDLDGFCESGFTFDLGTLRVSRSDP
ncbi:unnamed protein product [Bursaphelenchus xylophilus]|uniref:(pine wood nematode) hypothetical protein n=1 Tax=Bursaphelenchus xylophilus TaxID=6326 RepID=A0A7I8XGD9_BURXY|nr:unnamed protein product [Bursaphelenchus xylophilus]CAG9081391.1 unnamed protein product [Bursaphelenchus xylophilus]